MTSVCLRTQFEPLATALPRRRTHADTFFQRIDPQCEAQMTSIVWFYFPQPAILVLHQHFSHPGCTPAFSGVLVLKPILQQNLMQKETVFWAHPYTKLSFSLQKLGSMTSSLKSPGVQGACCISVWRGSAIIPVRPQSQWQSMVSISDLKCVYPFLVFGGQVRIANVVFSFSLQGGVMCIRSESAFPNGSASFAL